MIATLTDVEYTDEYVYKYKNYIDPLYLELYVGIVKMLEE